MSGGFPLLILRLSRQGPTDFSLILLMPLKQCCLADFSQIILKSSRQCLLDYPLIVLMPFRQGLENFSPVILMPLRQGLADFPVILIPLRQSFVNSPIILMLLRQSLPDYILIILMFPKRCSAVSRYDHTDVLEIGSTRYDFLLITLTSLRILVLPDHTHDICTWQRYHPFTKFVYSNVFRKCSCSSNECTLFSGMRGAVMLMKTSYDVSVSVHGSL